MSEHVFSLDASWSGGLTGRGHVESGQLSVDVSAPSAFGGPGQGTNPEELLLGAASACYLITLAAICQRRELPVTKIALRSEARITPPPALKVVAIVHRPVLTVRDGEGGASSSAALLEAAQLAEQFCMVSGAMRGNVKIHVEPSLVHA
jgi:peroxiredoxin-like protein